MLTHRSYGEPEGASRQEADGPTCWLMFTKWTLRKLGRYYKTCTGLETCDSAPSDMPTDTEGRRPRSILYSRAAHRHVNYMLPIPFRFPSSLAKSITETSSHIIQTSDDSKASSKLQGQSQPRRQPYRRSQSMPRNGGSLNNSGLSIV